MAVKITREDDEERIALLHQEYEFTSKLVHPNIVRPFNLFHNAFTGEFYTVMELAQGKPLNEVYLSLTETQ